MNNICENPDILSAMLIINRLILVIKIIVPVILIIITIIGLYKAMVNSNNFKEIITLSVIKFFIAAFIFFIPNFVEAVISLTPSDTKYKDCFDNATEDKIAAFLIRDAQELVKTAENSLSRFDYEDALYAVNRLQNGSSKTNLLNRLASLKSILDSDIKRKLAEQLKFIQTEEPDPSEPRPGVGGQTTGGDGKCQTGVVFSSEPDPSSAINCYPGVVNASNFVYPKDAASGLPLGAWPANYQSIPTQLSGYTVHNSYFVFPTTPVNGSYHFVYDHNGMDIMANFGTPIYSPVDGTMMYSEWGHTTNKGWDETAYTVSIKMSTPTTINGTTIDTVFMTHMSGIVYRCPQSACHKTIKKGQLIGFVGNAAGSAESPGWAPHLHITLYGNNNYNGGLRTAATEGVFDLPAGTSAFSIVAGG